ncbi:uncharacterized protein LOC123529578 [Mercenaria mercenaria]|uniref:uncharacterized protein LOC123529578 n=1 Tax=Mercenaria mercenaria TaxID=6596 RepID=UPI00234E9B43|nr:uncharacterized protein LOC123529578 [Mercenaria mercenaria]
MAIYMPPLCRKKRVLERYNPDTFRVISQFAEDEHLKHEFEESNKPSEWRKIWLENQGLALPDIYNRKTEVLPQVAPDFRINRPHPGSCGFLRHNVRSLNEPICSVYTEITKDEQNQWWPSRISNEPLQVPPRTNDTIYRGDFLERERPTGSAFGSLRHTSNPNKEPALGAVPVNFLRPVSGKQRLYKEKISYEHQYNSRNNTNYPIRGKRHGSFVWDQMSKQRAKQFVDHYSVISSEEGVHRQEIMEANRLATEAAKLLEDTNIVDATPLDTQPVPAEPQQAEDNCIYLQETTASRKNSGQSSEKKASSRKASISNGKPNVESGSVENDLKEGPCIETNAKEE